MCDAQALGEAEAAEAEAKLVHELNNVLHQHLQFRMHLCTVLQALEEAEAAEAEAALPRLTGIGLLYSLGSCPLVA
jgi:hypothetical protein